MAADSPGSWWRSRAAAVEPEEACRAVDPEEEGEVGSGEVRLKDRLTPELVAANEAAAAVGEEWQEDFRVWNSTETGLRNWCELKIKTLEKKQRAVDVSVWLCALPWFLKTCLSCGVATEGVLLAHRSSTDVNYRMTQTGTLKKAKHADIQFLPQHRSLLLIKCALNTHWNGAAELGQI